MAWARVAVAATILLLTPPSSVAQIWQPGAAAPPDGMNISPLLQAIKFLDKILEQKLGVVGYEEVENCSSTVSNELVAFLESNDTSPASLEAITIFDSWGHFMGDPGLQKQCTDLGYLYCGLYSNYTLAWTGVCLPSPCSPHQAEIISEVILEGILQDVKCYAQVTGWSTGTMIVGSCVAALVIFVLLATVYDLLFEPKHKKYRLLHDMTADSETESMLNGDRCGGGSINGTGGGIIASRMGSAESDSEYEYDYSVSVMPLPSATYQHCGCEEDRDHYRGRPSTLHFFRCFSIRRSYKLLTSRRKACSAGLRIFDGMRVLSITWIILGNILKIEGGYYTDSWYLRKEIMTPSFQTVLSASLATDTFLFMSGFLASYRMLHVYAYQGDAPSGVGAVCEWVRLIVRRYLRLTPLLGLVVVFYIVALPSMVEGPLWDLWNESTGSCSNDWWTILVYGNNFQTTNCMSWLWYTATDMQLFLIAPIITLLFWHLGVVALALLVTLTIGCVVANAILVQSGHFSACTENLIELTEPPGAIETAPWVRATPYLLGIGLALFYNAIGEADGASNLRVGPFTRALVLVLAAVTMLLPVYTPYDMRYHSGSNIGMCKSVPLTEAIYLTLYRLSWSVGLFLLTGSCLLGWTTWPRQMLSVHAFTPFSRLVYGVFLIHPILIERNTFGEDKFPEFSPFKYVLRSSGIILLSFLLSLLLYLLIEGPLFQIRQLLR